MIVWFKCVVIYSTWILLLNIIIDTKWWWNKQNCELLNLKLNYYYYELYNELMKYEILHKYDINSSKIEIKRQINETN